MEQVAGFGRWFQLSSAVTSQAGELYRLAEVKGMLGVRGVSCAGLALVCLEIASGQHGETFDKVERFSFLSSRHLSALSSLHPPSLHTSSLTTNSSPPLPHTHTYHLTCLVHTSFSLTSSLLHYTVSYSSLCTLVLPHTLTLSLLSWHSSSTSHHSSHSPPITLSPLTPSPHTLHTSHTPSPSPSHHLCTETSSEAVWPSASCLHQYSPQCQ